MNPYLERIVAFTVGFINTIPLLTRNQMTAPWLLDTGAWEDGPSLMLQDAYECIHYVASIVREETGEGTRTGSRPEPHTVPNRRSRFQKGHKARPSVPYVR